MTSKEYNEQFTSEELKKEIWKSVEGFEECYQVSNLGRIKSLARCVRNKWSWQTTKEKIIKARFTKSGYCIVSFNCFGKKYPNKYYHRIVLETFVGPCPEGLQCCHNDDCKQNNRLENLRWDTYYSNLQDKYKFDKILFGTRTWNNKLTEEDVRKIIKLCNEGIYCHKEIANMFNIAKSTVSGIFCRKRWKHLDI